jgi:hypothetical protein
MDITQIITLAILLLYFIGYTIFKIIDHRKTKYTKRISINIESDSIWGIGKTLELLGKKILNDYKNIKEK